MTHWSTLYAVFVLDRNRSVGDFYNDIADHTVNVLFTDGSDGVYGPGIYDITHRDDWWLVDFDQYSTKLAQIVERAKAKAAEGER